MKNANRKGKKLGPYAIGRSTPVFVTRLPEAELRELSREMIPTTPLEHHLTRALLDVPIDWIGIQIEKDHSE